MGTRNTRKSKNTKKQNRTHNTQQHFEKHQHKNYISLDERHHYIEVAAYYNAERYNFQSNPENDWLTAEQEIDTQFEIRA